MRGSVFRRKGRKAWSVIVDMGRDPGTGRRKQQWHNGYRTKREAERAMTEIMGRLERSEYVAPSKVTVERFLTEKWLPSVKTTVRPSTFAIYRAVANGHVLPYIGDKRLQQLHPADLDALYATLTERGLAPKTVRNVHSLMRSALRDAVTWGNVTRNVASLAKPPRVTRTDMRTWNAHELRAFLDHVADDRLFAAWLLLATTGMRRGEALGLHWRDVSLDRARLSVRQALVLVGNEPALQEPKTAKGRRSIPLPPETVAALKAHRVAQAQEQLALGPDYATSDLVFRRIDGKWVHPTALSRRFEALVRQTSLPEIRLHDLRHTFATLALQEGVAVKVVSEMLGHASVTITYDTYSHVIPGMAEDATSKVAALLFPAHN
jgi:integrase